MAAAMYGVLFGVGSVVLTKLAPEPLGAVFLWGFVALQLALGARVCWRRAGLPFATAAMAHGAVVSLCLVALALMGQPYPRLAPSSWVWFAGGVIVGPALLWFESRVNKTKWAAWVQHMEQMNGWDILTGRHIPQLRDDGA